MTKDRQQWVSLIILLCAFIGFVTFLFGYFPLKYHGGFEGSWNDLPGEINGYKIDGKKLYVGNRMRIVLMVIDALRYDFVSSKYMPYTASMIENQTACLFRATAEPPTVTMPRIKSPYWKQDKAQWRRTVNIWRDLFAMTTGSVSNFIDVALNFGSSAVTEDTFLNQAKLNDKVMVFYGDDTWLKLFPDFFKRSEGTTSFYVSDYTQVDLNVTRNLENEFPTNPNGPDWDLMILHYLGLDHIGHLEGPASPKVIPKMLEMDAIIKRIVEATGKWKDETVLLLCGDHGMKDSGSHGGATFSEITVPVLITQRKGCYDKYNKDINQIDIASTLSYMLGVPIPRGNTGQIIPQIIGDGRKGDLSSKRALYALHYNAKLNMDALTKMLGPDETLKKECYNQFGLAEKSFSDWLSTNQPLAKRASTLYQSSLNNISHLITKSIVEFDMFAIILGIIIIGLAFTSQVLQMIHAYQPQSPYSGHYKWTNKKRFKAVSCIAGTIVFMMCIIVFFITCGVTQTDSALCKMKPLNLMASAILMYIVVAFLVNIKKLFLVVNKATELKNLNAIEIFLILGTLIQGLTYGGTSFIEEEHQSWYFMWVTVEFLVLVYSGSVLVDYFRLKRENATEIQDKGDLEERMYKAGRWLLPQWVFLMFLHRFLRTLNQTGDKWAFLPDTGDWLNEEGNKNILSPIAILAMCGIAFICISNLDRTNNCLKLNTFATIGATISIFLYRVVTLEIEGPFEIPMYSQIKIVQLFWIFIAIIVITELSSSKLYILSDKSKEKTMKKYKESDTPINDSYLGDNDSVYVSQNTRFRDTTSNQMADHPASQMLSVSDSPSKDGNAHLKMKIMASRTNVFVNISILVCSLLLRPHNLILVPSVYLTSKIVNKILDHKLGSRMLKIDTAKDSSMSKNIFCKAFFHTWIGMVFYFYQGNSNSLASIDLGSGYVGLEDYFPVYVALQMGVHTYTGPLLAGLFLFADCVRINTNYNEFLVHLKQLVSTVCVIRIYPILVYSIIATILRYHLFVWTVISPKLLYDFTSIYFSLSSILTMKLLCCSVDVQMMGYTTYLEKKLDTEPKVK